MKFRKNNISLSFFDYKVLNTLIEILKFDCVRDNSVCDDDLFFVYKDYSIESIISFALSNNLDIEDEVRKVLLDQTMVSNYLQILISYGEVVRNIGVPFSDTYRYVPKRLQDSSYTRGYSSIAGNNPNRVLLISDTHFGNSEYADYSLVYKLFDYAKEKYDINDCIHLGDVFQGVRIDKGEYSGMSLYDDSVRKILEEQINEFSLKFPDNMNVVAVSGNHDENIIKYLHTLKSSFYDLNESYLTILKPNFRLLKHREYGNILKVGDMRICLIHNFQYNMWFPYVKTTELDSDKLLSSLKSYNTNDIDLYLSGHFHYSYNKELIDDNFITKRHYEVLPSLSKMYEKTKDGCIGKIIRFIYNNSNVSYYGITNIYFFDDKIVEGKESIYPTNYTLTSEKTLVKRQGKRI